MDLNLVEKFVESNPELIQTMAKDRFFRAKVTNLYNKRREHGQLDRSTLRLSDFSLKDGLEEVVTWGVRPLKWLVTLLDKACDERDDPADLIFLRYEMGTWLENLEDTLMRFDAELQDWKRKEAIA